MELIAFFFSFAMFWKLSTSVRCYECLPEKVFTSKIPLCNGFDYGDAYKKDCNQSTVCIKKFNSLTLDGTTVSSVYRGCAPQTFKGDQEKVNGKWYLVNRIYEPYVEGCTEDHRDTERVTKTINCYCRGDLCNTAPSIAMNALVILVGLTLVLTITG